MEKHETPGSISGYSFDKLFDEKGIQELQEIISKSVEIGMEMKTPDGRSITKNSIACDFCHKVVRSSECGRENCRLSDEIIGSPKKEGPIIAPCRSAGLLDAGVSIMVGDEHVASWLMGQVRDADNLGTEEEHKKRAEELGIDPDWFCEELEKVPVMTRERFENIANLVYIIAKQLSGLGLKSYLQQEEIVRIEMLQEQLTYVNQHDTLTGLYNRAVYEDKFKKLNESGICPISVVVADANYLKLSNDIFGHEEGDKLLKQIADALLQEADPWAYVCRCGGDEFYVLMPNIGKEEAEDYIRRVRERYLKEYSTVLPPSLAIGVETKASADVSLEKVAQWAEDRMYQEKTRIKSESNMLREIRKIIYETGYLSEETYKKDERLTLAFADFLGFDDYRKSYVKRILAIKNLGLIAVPKIELAKAREFMDYTFEVKYDVTEIEHRLSRIFDETIPVAGIIGQRREQWDGNGRPHGISGEQLDFLTRFISMTDCYIILTGKGPHGFGLQHGIAMREMLKRAGTVLDPQLTVRFVEFMQQYREEEVTG